MTRLITIMAGPEGGFVLSAYLAALTLLCAMIGGRLVQARRARLLLEALEARGFKLREDA
jgi:hypothetical protein